METLTKRKSSYSDVVLKGTIGFNHFGWAAIAMERAKSDKPDTPVLCEVFGFEQEMGSMYRKEFRPTNNYEEWKSVVEREGHTVEGRYFKGALLNARGEVVA